MHAATHCSAIRSAHDRIAVQNVIGGIKLVDTVVRHRPAEGLLDITWHAGESDLTGEVAINQRGKPSRLTARLASQHLAFTNLAPLVGATPARTRNVSRQQAQTETELAARGELFPNVPLHVERLAVRFPDSAGRELRISWRFNFSPRGGGRVTSRQPRRFRS